MICWRICILYERSGRDKKARSARAWDVARRGGDCPVHAGVDDGECVRCVEREVWCRRGEVRRAGAVHAAGGGSVWAAAAAAMGMGAGVGWMSYALPWESVCV